jgi:menaquinone-dependent protoporphyrinogen oxidase
MNTQVLVAYGTKYGATAEIADGIAEVLRAAHLTVTVAPANQVDDVTKYGAVVLGSAVYAGSWQKDAAHLLESNESALVSRPVWLFSSGPTGAGDPVETMHGWRFPDALKPIAERIKPRDIAVFGGKIDLDKLHLPERLIILAMRVKTGDFRNWDVIRAWAGQIVSELTQTVAA